MGYIRRREEKKSVVQDLLHTSERLSLAELLECDLRP